MNVSTNHNFLQATHTTKDGTTYLVTQMENQHLLNTIRYFLRQAVDVIPNNEEVSNPYKDALYGTRKRLNPEEAAFAINRLLFELSPYIMEAFFRQKELQVACFQSVINDILSLMKKIYARDSKLETPKNLKFLESDIEEEFDEIVGENIDDLRKDIPEF